MATDRRPLFAEGEYLGEFAGHPNDPRSDSGAVECPECNDIPSRRAECDACDSAGHLDEFGNPVRLDGWGMPIQMEERA